MVTHVEAASERGPAEVRRWAESPGLVALAGSHPWDPRWSRRPPFLLDVPALADNDRLHTWTLPLEGKADHLSLSRAVAAYRLTPEQVDRAARGGPRATTPHSLEAEDLRAGARGQNRRPTETSAPDHCTGELGRFGPASQHRWTVSVHRWSRASTGTGLRRVAARLRLISAPGVTALFAGDSGTGKTMSAEVVARSLGLDLYIIDLSTVVDKYIGETEKNLDRIFGSGTSKWDTLVRRSRRRFWQAF